MTEGQRAYIKSISDPNPDNNPRIDVYIPVYANGELIRDGNKRKHKNQHIRLDHIDVKDKTVLDFGCNTGYIAFRLIEKGAKHITAIDLKPELIKICLWIWALEKHYNTIDFICANKYDWANEYNDTFDIGLNLSNFDYDKTIDELKEYGHLAKTWYIEPTNHNPHYKTIEEILEWGVNELSQFGEVEFLTHTDYQHRGLFKLVIK
jgi:SAM-dependent methyltransferase